MCDVFQTHWSSTSAEFIMAGILLHDVNTLVHKKGQRVHVTWPQCHHIQSMNDAHHLLHLISQHPSSTLNWNEAFDNEKKKKKTNLKEKHVGTMFYTKQHVGTLQSEVDVSNRSWCWCLSFRLCNYTNHKTIKYPLRWSFSPLCCLLFLALWYHLPLSRHALDAP